MDLYICLANPPAVTAIKPAVVCCQKRSTIALNISLTNEELPIHETHLTIAACEGAERTVSLDLIGHKTFSFVISWDVMSSAYYYPLLSYATLYLSTTIWFTCIC